MTSLSQNHQLPATGTQGYLEGYYGKLLTWCERSELLKSLAALQLNTYCYAPKEDSQHRLNWRDPYESKWRGELRQFCTQASNHNISIVAGIAPGLDFNHTNSTRDFESLHAKAKQFTDDGVHEVLILWDDIAAPALSDPNAANEGKAHARIVNRLSEAIGQPLWTVPRVYAEEIENQYNYLENFFTELQMQHTVLVCGKAIVAREVRTADLVSITRSNSAHLKHQTILWDNHYANDYCPRRLFLGPWAGREEITDYLINATGMPYTDQLLLDIVTSTHNAEDRQQQWLDTLKRHGVPDAFNALTAYFSEPFFGDRAIESNSNDYDCPTPSATVEDAIEECLWKWKTPLAREWYPFIFGLKHDLGLVQQTLPRDRILKTQTPCLAKRLLN